MDEKKQLVKSSSSLMAFFTTGCWCRSAVRRPEVRRFPAQ